MNATQNAAYGRRYTSEIRFTDVRVRRDDVEFDALGDTGERIHFSIDADIVRALGGGSSDAALAQLFENRKRMILGVASRAFNAGVRGDPIRLHRDLFRSL